MKLKNRKETQGFVLLFAVLMVSIVLSVSLILFDITLKQLILSSTGKESQLAYYAAEAGLDCAFYWDRYSGGVQKYFGSFNNIPVTFSDSDSSPTCAGGVVTLNPEITDGSTYQQYDFTLNFTNGSCAFVSVVKQDPNDTTPYEPAGAGVDTFIRSRGHSQRDSLCGGSATRVVERTVTTKYNDIWVD